MNERVVVTGEGKAVPTIGAATMAFVIALNKFADATGRIHAANLRQVRAMGDIAESLHDAVAGVQRRFPGSTLRP